MSRVLSIEVGSLLTRICEVDYRAKKVPKVYKSVTVPTPEKVVEDGFIGEDSSTFAEVIKRKLAENKIKTKQVIFTVTSSKIVTREAILPVLKPAQTEAMIRTNITDYLPIDLANFELAFMNLGNVTEEDGTIRNRVLIMAADKTLVDSYDRFAEELDMKLICLDYSGNSVYQAMKNECKDDTEMIIKVEDKSTTCTIISHKNLVMQRNVAYGVDSVVQEVIEHKDIFEAKTFDQAMAILSGKTCLRSVISDTTKVLESNDDARDDARTIKAKEEVTFALYPLVSNIGRVIDLFNSRNPETPIKRVEIIGLGSDISGISKLLTNELGVKSTIINNVTSMYYVHDTSEEKIGRYVAAAGAAIDPVGFVDSDKQKKNDLHEVNYVSLTILTVVLILLVAGILCYFALVPYFEAQLKNASLKSQEATYAPYEETYNQYVGTEAMYAEVRAAYLSTKNPNDNLLQFLTDLEKTLPWDAILTEITSNDSVATISMEVDTMEKAAAIIQEIRAFDCLAEVSASELVISELDTDDMKNRVIMRLVHSGMCEDERAAEALLGEEVEDDYLMLALASDYIGMLDKFFDEDLELYDGETDYLSTVSEYINTKVTFTLNCTYKPLGEDVEEEVAE